MSWRWGGRGLWALAAGDKPLTVDLDSTICEVHGKHKGGAAYGYTKVLGYHPLLAARADTGEVLAFSHAGSADRLSAATAAIRATSSSRNLRRLGADAAVTVRADSGFWSPTSCSTAIDDHKASLLDHRRARSAGQRSDPSDRRQTPGPTIAYTQGGRPKSPRAHHHQSRAAARESQAHRSPDGAPHPPRRAPRQRDVARLAPPRVHHQQTTTTPKKPLPEFHRGHARRRARHPRPQRQRLWVATSPQATVRRQRRMARLRSARPQPPALDRAPRTARHHSAPTHRRTPTVRKRLLTVPARLLNHSDTATDWVDSTGSKQHRPVEESVGVR